MEIAIAPTDFNHIRQLHELLPADAADVLIIRGDPEVQKYADPRVRRRWWQTKNQRKVLPGT